jgi:hypothetical protein
MFVKFSLGEVVITPGALDTFAEIEYGKCLSRHVTGDWGDLCDEDKQTNEIALNEGLRLFSSYIINGNKLWIITEWDRSATTLLLPSEY